MPRVLCQNYKLLSLVKSITIPYQDSRFYYVVLIHLYFFNDNIICKIRLLFTSYHFNEGFSEGCGYLQPNFCHTCVHKISDKQI